MLAVIGFHAFPTLVPGGFVGVDVFFVISGYLISQQILSELAEAKFTIRRFYARRVKRIFPALVLVLFTVTAAGWILLTPVEYELLGGHIAGGAGFVANLVFWKQAGYFDVAADTKPLLHLWSLGIEEQFYIVWPLLLAILSRRAPHALARTIAALCVLSLVYSIWLAQRDVTADFYSPLTRLWELGLGAAIAHRSMRAPATMRNQHLAAWLGVALIALALVAIDRNDRFPGAWALLPTLGTALVIFAGESRAAWLNHTVLAARPMVAVGLISYPLYLWHWPLLSFARIVESETPAMNVRLVLVGVAFLLAWATYRIVERPVRSKPMAQSRGVIITVAVLMLIVFSAGVVIRKLDGFKFRALTKLDGDVSTLVVGADRGALRQQCGLPETKLHFEFCLSKNVAMPPAFAVIGDSKAEALYYGLARESPADLQSVLIGTVLPPKLDAPADEKNQSKALLAFNTVRDMPTVRAVVMAFALRSVLPANAETGFIERDVSADAADALVRYGHAIQQFQQAGKRVLFVIDNPTLPDPRSCISGGMTSSAFLNQFLRRNPNPRCTIRLSEHLAGTAAYRQFVKDLAQANPDLVVYDPTSQLCDAARDVCPMTRDGKFLYSYTDHVSDTANSPIARELLPLIEQAIAP